MLYSHFDFRAEMVASTLSVSIFSPIASAAFTEHGALVLQNRAFQQVNISGE